MEHTVWHWVCLVIPNVCLGVLTIAAGLAFTKLKRWSLACLFVSALLMLNLNLYVVATLLAQSYSRNGFFLLFWILGIARCADLIWVPAVVGGVGEAIWFIRKSSMRSCGG